MKVFFQRTTEGSIPPIKAKPGDAAYDLFANDYATIPAGKVGTVSTGISLAIPEGYYGRIAGRSGLAARDRINTLGGVIDSNYRGEIGVILHNISDKDFEVIPGNRIAQLIIEKCYDVEFECNNLPDTNRGDSGFGSTGK